MSASTSRMDNPDGGTPDSTGDRVVRLLPRLANPNGLARQRARESLVALGTSAVPALTTALSNPNWRVRWEAAKALTEIADPTAADALVATMEDERPGVRWIASEGVIALGYRGLVPLLQALIRKADSAWFRVGAHHVLRALEGCGMDRYVQPVLKALSAPEPSMEVPLVAEEALDLIMEDRSR